MDVFTLLFALLNALVVILYCRDFVFKNSRMLVAPAISLLIMAVVISLLKETAGTTSAFFALSFVLLFSILPFYYMVKNSKMLPILLLVILEFFYATIAYGTLLYPFIQALAIGTGCGFLYKSGFRILKFTHVRAGKDVESRRDVAHLLLGIIVISLFAFLPLYYAIYATTTLILVGYVANSLLGGKKAGNLYALLNSIERPEVIYGLGALYLGVGTALMIGFVHDKNFLIVGLSSLMLADPVATIIGVNTKGPKLFYNKRKSLYGTLAFFLVVAAVGYPFVGFYSLLFGAVMAVAESIEVPLDDNIGLAVVIIVIYVAFLAGAKQLPF